MAHGSLQHRGPLPAAKLNTYAEPRPPPAPMPANSSHITPSSVNGPRGWPRRDAGPTAIQSQPPVPSLAHGSHVSGRLKAQDSGSSLSPIPHSHSPAQQLKHFSASTVRLRPEGPPMPMSRGSNPTSSSGASLPSAEDYVRQSRETQKIQQQQQSRMRQMAKAKAALHKAKQPVSETAMQEPSSHSPPNMGETLSMLRNTSGETLPGKTKRSPPNAPVPKPPGKSTGLFGIFGL